MVNILSTLRFNINAFGLAKGLHLPVLIYGKIKMKSLGTIHIHCPIRRGLVIIGVNHDVIPSPCSVFHNTGDIEIHGKVRINFGVVFLNQGTVIFRGNDLIGKQCTFDIREKLDMGHDVSIGYETHITDNDNHFVVDADTRQVPRNSAAIRIGDYNWFGSNCFIKKGTVTPNYLTVASPYSMLSKDYSCLPPHTVLAGCPAKPVKQGIRRIYNASEEKKISDYFRQHPDEESYQIDTDADLDNFCKIP